MSESGPQISRDARMARHFVSLADTLVDDFDLLDLLDQLTRTCVELLSVTTAGLLILDLEGSLHPVAASTEGTRVLELFQLQSDEGPCLDCVRSGEVVIVPDVRATRDRWPRFSQALLDSEFHSVAALPMRLRNETIGSLNLFNVAGMPALSVDDRHIAQALDTRIVIEQAKGVLAEFGGVRVDVAFDALRSYARGANAKLGETADALVHGRLDPDLVIGRRDA